MILSIEEQLADILGEYTDEMGEEVNRAFRETAKDTRTLLKNTSNDMFKKVGSGKHYADGWSFKVTGEGLNTKLVVYNRLKPGLTHLLEHGHQVYVGKKNTGKRAGAHKHIEPAEKKATEELMRKLER